MATYKNNGGENAASVPKPDSDEGLLKASREGLEAQIENESDQRAKMLDDLRFAALDQWPADLRAQREGDVVNGPRPCLTVDNINQYITQVSNNMLKARPSIKPRPVDDVADLDTAKVYAGLIRHIEDQSNAQIAYQSAGESAVTIGLGFFRIVADYVSPERFDQELLIKRVPDTFSVYLGPHVMPDGSDAEYGWIYEEMPIETFKRDYPKAKVKDADFEVLGIGTKPAWKTDKTITVCEYFYKKYTPATLLYLGDGRAMFEDQYDAMPEPRPEITGQRDSHKVKVMWCKHSGCEVLDKRELKGQYIPIVEVVGKEKIVEGKRHLWGLVRPAKDSLRAFNYWISALMEKMALAPKAPFIGAVGQFATMGDKWDKANVNNYAKLEYDVVDVNGNAVPAPKRQEPMQMEPAMVQMLQMMQNNVKSSLGMYKAALGEAESQQSGRAILALQKESDTGTMHFGENQAISVTHCGVILVDLIPHYYDTKQALRILGEDGQVQTAQIDPSQREARREVRDAAGKIRKIYNLGVGKYDVTVTTGPGYTTSRQEAATVMTDLANSAKDPISAAIMRYGAVKNSDFHGSEEIMRMLKAMLPPQLQQPDGEEEVPMVQTPQGPIPAPQAGQMIGQLMQQMQQMAEALKKAGDLQKIEQQVSSKASDVSAKESSLQAREQMLKMQEQLAMKTMEADLAREEADRIKIIADMKMLVNDAVNRLECMKQQTEEVKHGEMDEQKAQQTVENNAKAEQQNAQVSQMQADLLAQLAQAIQLLAAPRKRTPVYGDNGEITEVIDEPVMQ